MGRITFLSFRDRAPICETKQVVCYAAKPIEHLLLHCVLAKMPDRFAMDDGDTWNWLRTGLTKKPRKGMDTVFLLIDQLAFMQGAKRQGFHSELYFKESRAKHSYG